MSTETAVVVSYPNHAGDSGRYELADQRSYFSRFTIGSNFMFELALKHVISGDLLSFHEECEEIFESSFQVMLSENTMRMDNYHDVRREFQRRTFDLYRYAKSSLHKLGENPGFTSVKRLSTNHRFDSGKFLLT